MCTSRQALFESNELTSLRAPTTLPTRPKRWRSGKITSGHSRLSKDYSEQIENVMKLLTDTSTFRERERDMPAF